MDTKLTSVDAYISSFPSEVQEKLKAMRTAILTNAPLATEGISYGMPAYKSDGKPLVYFAAFKNHVGFYATPTGHAAFSSDLSKYKQGKGSVQFPINADLPLELIARIVMFRAEENRGKK
ncbi:MAG: DUF1801 domain-containing protein [Cryomorphaceae bacterium]|nr:DUF1801 domain-containing protein [Cryomorphaceae bacterium]